MPITHPRTRTTAKALGITVEALEDNVTLDKAIQIPEDLLECPTLAILLPVQHSGQEKPLIPDTGMEDTSEVGVKPGQLLDENFWTQQIDKVLIDTAMIHDKIRGHEVKIVIVSIKSYIKLMDTVEIHCQL